MYNYTFNYHQSSIAKDRKIAWVLSHTTLQQFVYILISIELTISQMVETPLVANGDQIEVTNFNKMGYIKLVAVSDTLLLGVLSGYMDNAKAKVTIFYTGVEYNMLLCRRIILLISSLHFNPKYSTPYLEVYTFQSLH